MIKGRIIFFSVFLVNSASAVRRMALAKALAGQDADVTVLTLFPVKDVSIPENVKYVCLNENLVRKRKGIVLLYLSLGKIINFLKRGDRIMLYTVLNYELAAFFAIKVFRKVCLCNEITEYPDVVIGSRSEIGKNIKISCLLFQHKILVDRLFVISESLIKYFSGKGLSKNRITKVNMLVDESRFKKIQDRLAFKYIAYCGSISTGKDGVDILIGAFSEFVKKHGDYLLYIIGSFRSEEEKEAIGELIKRLGIGEKIVFTGKVTATEIPPLLCGARILALARPANRQAEGGFPTKLGEYLSTGNPVVVTNVGELADYLTHGENVVFAEPGSVMDFAEKLSWVEENYERACEIGEKGKESVKINFSSSRQARVLLDALKDTKL